MSHFWQVEPLESRKLLSSGSITIGGGGSLEVGVFNDLNADGNRNANEPWMAGIPVVKVYEISGNTGATGTNTAVTAANGKIRLSGGLTKSLNAGAVAGYRQSTPNPIGAMTHVDGRYFVQIGITTRALASGKVVDDLNGNGKVDADDVPIPGRVIFDDLNDNGLPDASEQTVTTDRLGRWTFNSLPAGAHNLRLRADGAIQTAPAGSRTFGLNLARGQSSTNNVFAQRGAIVRGTIFNDFDGDGVRDAIETPAANAFIYNDANNNAVWNSTEASTRSAADGAWALAGLPAGRTLVRAERRDDKPLTLGANGLVFNARLDRVATLAFGERGVMITGRAYSDKNGSGTYDAGDFAASTVWLDTNDNGKLDVGESSVSTYGGGLYSFGDLPAGTYTVRAESRSTLATYKTIQMQPTPHTDSAWQLTLAPGDVRVHRDFVFQSAINITASVYVDRNFNGVTEPGESIMTGRTVYLDLNDDGSLDNNEPSGVTNSKGTFKFSNLRPGTYVLGVVAADGWSFSGTGDTQTIRQQVGGRDLAATFRGRAGQISGRLFYDVDADGVYETDDYPAQGEMIPYIDVNDNGFNDVGDIDCVNFGSTGYSFDGLAPGHYVVRFFQGTVVGVPSAIGADRVEFDLAPGQTLSHDFSCVASAVCSGSIFNDVNGNGVHDGASEDLIYNFWIYLDLNNNSQRDDNEPFDIPQNGNWSLQSSPGRAVVRVLMNDGWHQVLPATGYVVHNLKAGQASKNNVFAVQRD